MGTITGKKGMVILKNESTSNLLQDSHGFMSVITIIDHELHRPGLRVRTSNLLASHNRSLEEALHSFLYFLSTVGMCIGIGYKRTPKGCYYTSLQKYDVKNGPIQFMPF